MNAQGAKAGQPGDGAGSSPARVVDDYLQAFYQGDFATARRLLADDLAFSGPFIRVEGAEPFLDSARPLGQIVRGHLTVMQWQEGPEVSTLYEMQLETPAGKGSVLVSEWNTVRDGKVASASLVFDTAAFRKLVPHAGEPAS